MPYVYQPVEVKIAPALPAVKGIGKAGATLHLRERFV
jgi:hypothetical protein